jgi:folate-binding protein YgfZ
MNLHSLSPKAWSKLPLFSGFTVSGSDANQFLQGQLTNDVIALASSRSQRTGYCTPKGRLMAAFLQWRISDDTLGHLIPTPLLESTTKRLKMFVLRSKAVFSGPERTLSAFGLWLDDATASAMPGNAGDVAAVSGLAKGQAWLIREGDGETGARLWLIADPEGLPEVQQHLASHADRMRSQEAWLASEITSGQPWIWPQTVEAFVPQMINFELIGGVSFKKGCYPGQEVVARSQYLGKLKRRTFHVSAQLSDETLHALFGNRSADGGHPLAVLLGADIWSSLDETQPVGQVVDAAHAVRADGSLDPISIHLLVESTLDAWSHGALSLGGLTDAFPRLAQEKLPYLLSTPE